MTNPPDSAAQWAIARSYAAQLGQIPSSFTTATRSLALDAAPDCAHLEPSTTFLVKRLMKTGTIKTALSFAAATFKPERYPTPGQVDLGTVLADYRPLDLAAVIGLIYIYRRARAICPEAEWVHVDKQIARYLDTSIHVGYALPNAGVAAGVFVGGFIPLAQAMFLKHDLPGFKDYRRYLASKKGLYEVDFEMSRWGCSSPILAAFFIQTLGLGIQLAEKFSVGLESKSSDGEGLDDGSYRFYILKRWALSILETGEIPNMTHQGRYYPLKTDQDRLKKLTAEAGESGSRHRWLERTQADLENSARGEAVSEVDEIAAALQEDS